MFASVLLLIAGLIWTQPAGEAGDPPPEIDGLRLTVEMEGREFRRAQPIRATCRLANVGVEARHIYWRPPHSPAVMVQTPYGTSLKPGWVGCDDRFWFQPYREEDMRVLRPGESLAAEFDLREEFGLRWCRRQKVGEPVTCTFTVHCVYWNACARFAEYPDTEPKEDLCGWRGSLGTAPVRIRFTAQGAGPTSSAP